MSLISNRWRSDSRLAPCHRNPYRWVQASVALHAEKPCGRYPADDNAAPVHGADLQQACSSDVHQNEKFRQAFSRRQCEQSLQLKVLYLLCRVWSAEPRICPSPPISRCSPGLAAYRCLCRTTWPQRWAMWGPWSDRGIQTTPTAKNIVATDTVPTSSSMIGPILCTLSVAVPSSRRCEAVSS